MYSVEKFMVTDPAEIRAFVEQHAFAMIVATDANGGHAATHVPLLVEAWDEHIVLRGHVMRETDHGQVFKTGSKVFVCFHGPNAPVLGSWQMSNRFGGTWNYQAVHAHGTLQCQDSATLLAHLQTLKNRFETSPGHRFDSLPADYIEALTPHIQCIDIAVSELKCIFKLSQNRRIEEFDRTALELGRQGGQAALVADAMQSRRGHYYPEA